MNFTHLAQSQHSFRSFITNQRMRKAALSLAFLIFFNVTGAQDLSDYQKRELYDFTQCTDQCQIEFDTRAFICLQNQEDTQREESTNDEVLTPRCRLGAQQQYEQCLNSCPANPRGDAR